MPNKGGSKQRCGKDPSGAGTKGCEEGWDRRYGSRKADSGGNRGSVPARGQSCLWASGDLRPKKAWRPVILSWACSISEVVLETL